MAALVVTSCITWVDDEGNLGNSSITVINAKVENGEDYRSRCGGGSYNSTIKFVKALLIDDETVVATGTYSNGGFTIELPSTVDEQYLFPISLFADDHDDEDIIKNDIKFSNPNVKACNAYIYGFDKSDAAIYDCSTDFYYDTKPPGWRGSKDDRFYTGGVIIYVNGDVSITGSLINDWSDDEHYNIFLKKGWNIMYWDSECIYDGNTFRKEIFHITNHAPNNMKWWAN